MPTEQYVASADLLTAIGPVLQAAAANRMREFASNVATYRESTADDDEAEGDVDDVTAVPDQPSLARQVRGRFVLRKESSPTHTTSPQQSSGYIAANIESIRSIGLGV